MVIIITDIYLAIQKNHVKIEKNILSELSDALLSCYPLNFLACSSI